MDNNERRRRRFQQRHGGLAFSSIAATSPSSLSHHHHQQQQQQQQQQQVHPKYRHQHRMALLHTVPAAHDTTSADAAATVAALLQPSSSSSPMPFTHTVGGHSGDHKNLLSHILSFVDEYTLSTSCFRVCTAWYLAVSAPEFERIFRSALLQWNAQSHISEHHWHQQQQQQHSPQQNNKSLTTVARQASFSGDDDDDDDDDDLRVHAAIDVSLSASGLSRSWRQKYAIRSWCLQRVRETLVHAVSHVLLNTDSGASLRRQLDHVHSVPIFGATRLEWEREWRDRVRALRFRELIRWDEMSDAERMEFESQMIAQCRQFGLGGDNGAVHEYWERAQVSYSGHVMGIFVEACVPKGGPVQLRFDVPGADEEDVGVETEGTSGHALSASSKWSDERHLASGDALSLSFVDETRFTNSHQRRQQQQYSDDQDNNVMMDDDDDDTEPW